jgi:hypothetical protein
MGKAGLIHWRKRGKNGDGWGKIIEDTKHDNEKDGDDDHDHDHYHDDEDDEHNDENLRYVFKVLPVVQTDIRNGHFQSDTY